ncbi:MAG: hypothetical protein ACYDCC_05280 [Actinomycetota bacterium]
MKTLTRILIVAFFVASVVVAVAVSPVVASAKPDLSAFSKLGSWVDLYNYDDTNAWQATGVMQSHGVHTIYLETGRYNMPDTSDSAAFANRSKVDWWIHSAHARGMKIVGWYLPAYDNMDRDVRRTTLIWTYRTGYKQHFDGVGIDIEYKDNMPSLTAWDKAVADHFRRVRHALGTGAPIAAIVPAPLGMAVRPQDWKGFPWGALASVADLFMPMGYWSYRTDCSSNASHCAYGYTKGNIQQVRSLTGKSSIPVHDIGGVGNKVTAAQVQDYVRAVKDAGGFGGSLYDYHTTASSMWSPLSQLS